MKNSFLLKIKVNILKSMGKFGKIFISLLIIALSILYMFTRIDKSYYANTSVSIEIVSGSEDIYQFFYNSGTGYNEKESVRAKFSGQSNQKIVFQIKGVKFHGFRIDPGRKEGVIKIKQICFASNVSGKCWQGQDLVTNFKILNNIKPLSIEEDLLVVSSTGEDPCFEYIGNLSKEFDLKLNLVRLWLDIILLGLFNVFVIIGIFYFNLIAKNLKTFFNSKPILIQFKPQKIFLFFALIWGTLTVFVTPPFQVPDEPAHFFRSYQIANGGFIPETRNNLVGGFVPSSLMQTINLFSGIAFHPENKSEFENIRKSLSIPLNREIKSFGFFPNTGLYAPVTYTAQSLAIVTGQLFNLQPIILLYLGRLFNLLSWIIIIYFAIKITPIYKWLFLLMALMPMSLFQAASISADVFTNSISFLFIASIFKLAFEKNTSFKKKDLYLLISLLVLLTMSKYVYSFLLILFFIIPLSKFETKKNYIKTTLYLFIFTALTLSIGIYFVKQIYGTVDPNVNYYGNAPETPIVNPNLQIQYILTHIFDYLKTIILSFWILKEFLVNSFIGNLGWLDTPLPILYILIAVSLLCLLAITENNKNIFISVKSKFILLVCFGIIILTLATLLYLTWTPVGKSVISGLQGRYFIPIIPVFLTLFYNRKYMIPQKVIQLMTIVFLIISFCVMNYSLISRYYIN